MTRTPAPSRDRPWRRPDALRYALSRIRGIVIPPVTVTDPPADVERDVSVPTRDGTALRINVFRHADAGPRPVILSVHPYGKDNLPKRRGNRATTRTYWSRRSRNSREQTQNHTITSRICVPPQAGGAPSSRKKPSRG